MKVVILGAGAMGSLFGCYLSRQNQVLLVDTNTERVDSINTNGITLLESDRKETYAIQAVSDTQNETPADLIIVFVKGMYTRNALEMNRHFIGENTYILSLQNGAGHDRVLTDFADQNHVILGTTQHNSSITPDGFIHHGGGGYTSIGLMGGNHEKLREIADNFSKCGIETEVSDDIRRQLWRKLLLNASASSLTAVLRCPLGFVYDDPNAYEVFCHLLKEAVDVANSDGISMPFSYEEELERICTVLKNAPNGYTSIYADLTRKAKTEVNTISGYVVSRAEKLGVDAPYQHNIVSLIQAIEDFNELSKKQE